MIRDDKIQKYRPKKKKRIEVNNITTYSTFSVNTVKLPSLIHTVKVLLYRTAQREFSV